MIFNRKTAAVIIFILVAISNSLSRPLIDSVGSKEANTIFSKRNIAIVGVSGVFISTMIDSYFMWWKDNTHHFAFYHPPAGRGWLNDPGSKGIDKVGHFYTSYFFFRLQKNILEWGGVSKISSFWISSGMTLGLALLIEVGDGFSDYAFDYQDLVFNIGGLSYGILQDNVSFFKNFNFKWSFVPTDKFNFPPRFTEHYDSHIYWLSIDMHNLLKDTFVKFWPPFICPAVGFSVGNHASRREYIVGLDFNFNSLFNPSNENSVLIRNIVELFHVPAPGIKYSEKFKPEYKLFLLN